MCSPVPKSLIRSKILANWLSRTHTHAWKLYNPVLSSVKWANQIGFSTEYFSDMIRAEAHKGSDACQVGHRRVSDASVPGGHPWVWHQRSAHRAFNLLPSPPLFTLGCFPHVWLPYGESSGVRSPTLGLLESPFSQHNQLSSERQRLHPVLCALLLPLLPRCQPAPITHPDSHKHLFICRLTSWWFNIPLNYCTISSELYLIIFHI